MDAISRAVGIMGGQAALAGAIGLKQQNVWNWLRRGGVVPPVACVDIERCTSGAVPRWHLRPKDWHRIWPELIGAEGAPELPQPGGGDQC